jgi:thioredoxin reductase (NADPH)
MKNKKVIIIGSGCSGLTSAIYLSRANIDVTLFTGYSYGALENTPIIENFPGFPNPISGYELLDLMSQQVAENDVNVIEESIEKIDSRLNTVYSDSGKSYQYDALIVATGTKHRSIPIKNEKNVHYCAICDGTLYKNQEVCVIGGGNTALTDAIYLSNICKKVTIIIRRDVFRADKCLVDKVENTDNIFIIKNNQIKECVGEKELSHIILMDDTKIDAKAVFMAIGFDKNDGLLIDDLGQDYVLPDNIKICGDLKEDRHQAVIACASGAKVALDIIDEFNKE